jgi:hypothetical protein
MKGQEGFLAAVEAFRRGTSAVLNYLEGEQAKMSAHGRQLARISPARRMVRKEVADARLSGRARCDGWKVAVLVGRGERVTRTWLRFWRTGGG